MLTQEQIRGICSRAQLIYSQTEIEAGFDKIAAEMNIRLADCNPIFLCIVIGAIIPLGNLLKRLTIPLEVDYIHVTRYGTEFHGQEILQWKAKPAKNLNDRTVVIFDDILDEGLTLSAVIDYCYKQGAKEVLTGVMLDKKKPRAVGGLEKADFVALEVDDHYVFGYGLDYKEYMRNLNCIYAADPKDY